MEELQAGLKNVYRDCMNSSDRPECCYPFGVQAGILKEKPNWQMPEYCKKNGKADSKTGSATDSVMSGLKSQLDAIYSDCLKSAPKECCDPLVDHTKTSMPASCRDIPSKKAAKKQGASRSAGAL